MFLDDDMLVPDTVLFETLTVLNGKCGFSMAKEAHGKLAGNPQVSMVSFEAGEREAILGVFLSNAGKISTVDASVIYLSRKKGCKILSYDDSLNRAAARRI
jgi:predicted nucleic acid-binding protein